MITKPKAFYTSIESIPKETSFRKILFPTNHF